MTDVHRRRTIWRAAVAGPSLGLVGVVCVAAMGQGGRSGFVVMLLCIAVGSLGAALIGTLGAIVDEVRRVTVSRRRVALVVGHYAAAAFIVIALGAMAST